MLTLEDLLVANLAARRGLVGADPLRAALAQLDGLPERVPLARLLHERCGVGLEIVRELVEQARGFLRRKLEQGYARAARRHVPPQLLDPLVAEQARDGFAWSLGERLVTRVGLDGARHQELHREAVRLVGEEEARLLELNRRAAFAPAVGSTTSFAGAAPAGRPPPAPQPVGAAGADAERTLTFDQPPAGLQLGSSGVLGPRPPAGPQPGSSGVLGPRPPAPGEAEDPLGATVRLPPAPVTGARAPAQRFAPLAPPSGLLGGKYQLGRELGRGAMGVVWEARAADRPQPVAIKLVQGPAHAEARGRFKREILVSSRIKHPHVIEAVDAGELEDGSSYMVMELLSGQSLEALIAAHGPQPLARCLDLTEQLLDGLAAVHADRIVHRDLKPANVQVMEVEGRDHIKLVDFGVARILDLDERAQEQVFMTMKGQLSGTPQYVAPEAVLEPEKVQPSHDVYAAGVILYELLTGQLPFPPARSLRDILSNTVNARPRDLAETHPGGAPYAPALERFVRRLLEKDADVRPADGSAALALLRETRAELARGGAAPAARAEGQGEARGLTARMLRGISRMFGRKVD